jgi:hypothetical protein
VLVGVAERERAVEQPVAGVEVADRSGPAAVVAFRADEGVPYARHYSDVGHERGPFVGDETTDSTGVESVCPTVIDLSRSARVHKETPVCPLKKRRSADVQIPATRLRPTDDQVRRIRTLFDGVPVEHRYGWSSPQGRAFIATIRATVDHGVPASWLATELGLPPSQLYVLLSRYKEGAA